MKQFFYILLAVSMVAFTGCQRKSKYVPEAQNDKVYTSVGADKGYQGDGYTIRIPDKNYRYEKDYEDGNLEEKWDYTKKNDVEIKVTTYKNSDELTARTKFLRENDDYIFEDLMGYSLCGTEPDGDTLWLTLHQSENTVYIVSWEYPEKASEELKRELSDIAGTFKLKE